MIYGHDPEPGEGCNFKEEPMKNFFREHWFELIEFGFLLTIGIFLFAGCASVRNPICLFNCGDKQIFNPPVLK